MEGEASLYKLKPRPLLPPHDGAIAAAAAAAQTLWGRGKNLIVGGGNVFLRSLARKGALFFNSLTANPKESLSYSQDVS